MPNIFALQEIAVADESGFAPNTTTWTTRFPTLEPPQVSLNQTRITDTSLRSRMNEESLSHIGAQDCSISFKTYNSGHGTATTGALSATWQYNLLKDGLGGGSATQVGGTVNVATSATQFSTTGVTTATGSIIRVGAKGDGRADGQAAVVNVAATATMLTALPATPQAADVIYATLMAYHDESVSQTLTTKRFLVSHIDTGAQYALHGCQLANVSFEYPIGGMPTITWTYQGAWWQRVADTTPSARSLEAHNCAPIAGGRMFKQTFGTATAAVLEPASVSLSLDMGLQPKPGPGGVSNYQSIIGWSRSMVKPSLTVQVPWSTAYETTWLLANASYTYEHILFNFHGADTTNGGFYLPRVFQKGQRPSYPVEVNGQNYVSVTYQGTESTTTTNELTRSAIRFFFG
jgi:hypothetical protein